MTLVEAHESQTLWVEVELDLTNGTVTVLGDDEIGDVLYFWIVWLVVARAIDETDNIGILLNRSRFAQI